VKSWQRALVIFYAWNQENQIAIETFINSLQIKKNLDYGKLGGTLVKKSRKYVSKNIMCNILVVG
jgi:hypothetical protein